MPPLELKDFFIATAGASASFIGLLFVAISFVLNDRREPTAERIAKRILAESSYAALVNIFFVSLVALIPNVQLGYVMVAMAYVGIINTIHCFRSGPRGKRSNSLLAGISLFYVLEAVYGGMFIAKPDSYVINQYLIMGSFMFLFSIALARAWALTGIRVEK